MPNDCNLGCKITEDNKSKIDIINILAQELSKQKQFVNYEPYKT